MCLNTASLGLDRLDKPEYEIEFLTVLCQHVESGAYIVFLHIMCRPRTLVMVKKIRCEPILESYGRLSPAIKTVLRIVLPMHVVFLSRRVLNQAPRL